METLQMALSELGLAQSNGLNGIVLGISVAVGVLSLLYGYRLIRAFIFLIGFVGAAWIASMFVDQPAALVIGLVVGGLLVVFWYLGIFILGAVLGALASVLLGANDRIVVSVCAILGGILAVSVRKFFIILSTSFYGGSTLVSVVAALVEGIPQGVTVALSLALAGLGIWFQYRKAPAKVKSDEKPAATTSERKE